MLGFLGRMLWVGGSEWGSVGGMGYWYSLLFSVGRLAGLVWSVSDDREVRMPGRYALLYLIRTLIRFSRSIMRGSHSVDGLHAWLR